MIHEFDLWLQFLFDESRNLAEAEEFKKESITENDNSFAKTQ